jgi:GcrA cell cycle regulator
MAEPRPTLPPCRRCRYPIGDPREPGFRFCDARDVVPGKPYCLPHVLVCYQQPASDQVEEPQP